jgi:subtilisin-like proprotein convertase family protein
MTKNCLAIVTYWAAVVALLGTPAHGQAIGTNCAVPALAIPDADPLGVSSTINLTTHGTLQDLNVKVNITHTFDFDLQLKLKRGGITVLLCANRGGAGDNFNDTIFDDEAATAISAGMAPFAGSFRPEEPLSVFDGQDVFGNWTLNIADTAGDDTGTLNSWCLIHTTVDTDADGVPNLSDNCPNANPGQENADGDAFGDACDPLPTVANDQFGHRFIDSNAPHGPPFQFIDISATGAEILPFNNGTVAGPLAIGFPFNFYGADFTNAFLDDNGWLHLGDVAPPSDQTNDCALPSTTGVNNMIAGLWDALNPKEAMPNGRAFHQSFPAGACPYNDYPGACFIAEWLNTYRDTGGEISRLTFEIVLLDNGDILVQILDASDQLGTSSTTGIENLLEDDGLAYDPDGGGPLGCNVGTHVTDNLSIMFFVDPLDDDGIPGSIDNCLNTANPDQADADSDGLGDACDGCPDDAAKSSPGQCGCGTPDTDGDGDGTADCNDQCPDADDTLDADGNGTPDCLDAPADQTGGCCAPGVFPMVGLFTPMVIVAWKRRRRAR